jgi:hypothetical protein
MKRPMVALIALSVSAILAASAPASADTLRIYRGRTSQTRPTHARKVEMRVVKDKRFGDVRLKTLQMGFRLECDDGSLTDWGAYPSFGLNRPQIKDGVFSFANHFEPNTALRVRGTIRPRKGGEGIASYTVVMLTDDEQPLLCTKDVRWDVHLSKVIRNWSPGH